MLKVSETFIVGVDITQTDETVLTVAMKKDNKMIIVNSLHGYVADYIYHLLMTNSWKEKRNA